MATHNQQKNTFKGGGALDDQVDPQEYARLLDLYESSFRNIAEGEVVKGTVLKGTPSEVIVDVGYKSEGIIPVDEFVDETGQITVQAGDTVTLTLTSRKSSANTAIVAVVSSVGVISHMWPVAVVLR